MPPAVTASTGLDAFTQVIEPFVSHLSNPLTDTICREGIVRAANALRCAFKESSAVKAREDMAFVSLCGGLALANAKLGAVHGFAGVLGGMFSAPHGAICGRLLPLVMEANVRALKKRDPENPALSTIITSDKDKSTLFVYGLAAYLAPAKRDRRGVSRTVKYVRVGEKQWRDGEFLPQPS